MLEFATRLVALGERQGKTALRAAELIRSELRAGGISFYEELVDTFLPEGSSSLIVDGKVVDSAPTSFISGTICGKDALVSSLIPTRYLIERANINFNPRSQGLSLPNFYFAPSLAVRRNDVSRILTAEEVEGKTIIEKTQYELPQILVGNTSNPEAIVFSHFDSIGPGAIDNASGTAVCLSLVLEDPALLATTLFVFDPNEELSYDFPTYWGHGYRVFEERHGTILENAKSIVVVDCVGNGAPKAIGDPEILTLAFPVASLQNLLNKTTTIGGDIDKMLEVYQSDLDVPSLLSEEYLLEARNLLRSLILKESTDVIIAS